MVTAIRAQWLFDGTGAHRGDGWTVLVEGQRITAVGESASVAMLPSTDVIDLGNATLLPGLIDAHTHLASSYTTPPAAGNTPVGMALHSAANILRDLGHGVTALRCMGDPDFMDAEFKSAQQIGGLLGPDLVVSTRGLQASNGTMSTQFAVSADGPDEIRKVVRENLRRGADVIKLFVSGGIKTAQASTCFYSVEEIRAAVDEAHRFGKPVGAHAYGGGDAIRNCIDGGVDMIEHGALISRDEVGELIDKGIWIVVSINVYRTLSRLGGLPASLLERIEQSLQDALRSGVRFAVATDGMHGSLSEDIIAIHEWGIPATDVLLGATSQAAEVCGLADRSGKIAPGNMAHLIGVHGNLPGDLPKLRAPIFVMHAGRDLTRLAQMIDQNTTA